MYFLVPLFVNGAGCAYLGPGGDTGGTDPGLRGALASTWQLIRRRQVAGREERDHRSFSP